MELYSIEKVLPGQYLRRYNLTYKNKTNKFKRYEMVSNNPSLDFDNIGSHDKNSVILVVFDATHEHMLLAREFRCAVNQYVWGNAAGFIEKGETSEQAAARELKEEAGLDLIKVVQELPVTFTCAPLTDQTTSVLIVEAAGELRYDLFSYDEEIEPHWLSKDELREKLLDTTELFAGRTQAFAWSWVFGV